MFLLNTENIHFSLFYDFVINMNKINLNFSVNSYSKFINCKTKHFVFFFSSLKYLFSRKRLYRYDLRNSDIFLFYVEANNDARMSGRFDL